MTAIGAELSTVMDTIAACDSPWLSLTVNRAMWVPPVLYTEVATAVVASVIPSASKSHAYEMRIGGIRVTRAAPVERDGQRRIAGEGRCRGQSGRRQVACVVLEASNRAVHIDVVDVAVGPELELHGPGGAGLERLTRRRIGIAVDVLEHHPDAAARVVSEEERAIICGGVRGPLIERYSRDRRAACRARFASDDGRAVVVCVEGRRHRGWLRVEVFADAQVGRVVPALAPGAFIAGPSEVDDGPACRSRDAVDLLPDVPTHVANVDLASPCGRAVIRNGLRSPYAMMRLALASALAASGLSGNPAPVSGSTRISVPSRVTGSPLVCRS